MDQGFCHGASKLNPAQKQAAIASLKELIAQMQGKMAEGDGEKEMSEGVLAEAIEAASEGSAEESPKEEMSEEAAEMNEDMKMMLSGRKKPPSRAKMSVMAVEVKKPGKKFGKA
jgi:hypothetical protein